MDKKECPRCGRKLHPLGYARHMAMHRDADQLAKDREEFNHAPTGANTKFGPKL